MGIYEVLLGVDRAARDTGRRIHMRVMGKSALDAGITAEHLADQGLANPDIEYTHTIRSRPVQTPAEAMALAA